MHETIERFAVLSEVCGHGDVSAQIARYFGELLSMLVFAKDTELQRREVPAEGCCEGDVVQRNTALPS